MDSSELQRIKAQFEGEEREGLIKYFAHLLPDDDLKELLFEIATASHISAEFRSFAAGLFLVHTAPGKKFLMWWRRYSAQKIFGKDSLAERPGYGGGAPLARRPRSVPLELKLNRNASGWCALTLMPPISHCCVLSHTHIVHPDEGNIEDPYDPEDAIVDDAGALVVFVNGRHQDICLWADTGLVSRYEGTLPDPAGR